MIRQGLLFLVIVFVPVLAFAEVIDAVSSVSQAVVYPSGARVTRTVKVPLKEGPVTVRFKGVSPNFDEGSLSVSGRGSAGVRILGAGVRTAFLTESPDARVKELTAAIQAVDDDLAAQNGENLVLEQKKAFLESVRLFNGGQLPKDLITKVPTADELKSTLGFLEEGTDSYAKASQALAIKGREKKKEHDRLASELGQLQAAGQGKSERVLTADLECDKAGELTLEVSYNVGNASWYPLYDARVDLEKSKAVMSSFAVVNQVTGEDWTDVPLVLSTARPSAGGVMPELQPWVLSPVMAEQKRKREFFAPQMMRAEMSDGVASNVAGAVGGMEMEKVSQEARTVQAEASSSGVAVVYKAAHPVTVKADGSETRVPLTAQTLAAVFEYAATPKLSPYAYLRSTVTNGANDQLLPGRVNAFLDGMYVGASSIAKTVAAGEAFDLYLGVDEGVVVKRELLEEKSDDTLIGSIPSSTRKISYKYKIVVESYKPRAVTVKLFDQIPVAKDDKIKVFRVEASLRPDTEKYKDREGVYLWTLLLQPKEKKEIVLSYTVEYPREMTVSGL